MVISARRLFLVGLPALAGVAALAGAAAVMLAMPDRVAIPDVAPAASGRESALASLPAASLAAALAAMLLAVPLARAAWSTLERSLGKIEATAAGLRADLSSRAPEPASPIAEFRAAESALADMAEQLQARHRALVAAVETSAGADHSKSDFLAGMSHELRTPLNAVIGFAELLTVRAGARLEPRELGYVNDIIASGRHLLRVIEDLLEISRLESRRLRLSEETVELVELVQGVTRMLQPTAEARQLAIAQQLPELPLAILADPSKLRQIVANLLANAIKFTPPGGDIVVRARVDGDASIVVEVADTGVGMTPDQVERAVLPFTRATENPYVASTGGLGLGLAIAKALVELHGGRLEISSQAARGTTVRVRLPRERRAS